ncbi:MAG: peptidoglycan DD-metalloendopeptidase family protein [Gemmatimonadaceae bacterium]
MKATVARGVTYAIVGTLAWGAVELTPPVSPRSPASLSETAGTSTGAAASAAAVNSDAPVAVAIAPAVAALPESSVPELRYQPVVVTAERLRGVDTVALNGTIHSSLLASLEGVGQSEIPVSQRRSLAWDLADIFEHRVNMARDVDEGDKFHVLVERLQQPNGKIIINRILGARLSLGDRVVEAVHFKTNSSSSEWFDGKGKSLTASFLRAPVNFHRITSVFGLRNHPIFGTWRNHTGTDYAAPMGTPVHAIGDGVVVSVGRRGGYGNMIDIRHSNGMVSRYGHMSRFASTVAPGTFVKMGSTIGYVGMTGWATGPHLHFEIRVDGVARDPAMALRNQTSDPLTGSEGRLFREVRHQTLAGMRADNSSDNGLGRTALR